MKKKKVLVFSTKKKLFLFPLFLLAIGFLSFSPFIIGMIGSGVTEFFTGKPINEGNSFWGTLPWFTFFTIPIGGVVLLGLICILIYDGIVLLINYSSDKNH